MTRFVKKDLRLTVVKFRFEILNTMYFENAWCLVYAILHLYIVLQDNSIGILFNGLLDELPAILDSFFTSTTSDYIVMLGRGWWRATKGWEKHMMRIYTFIIDPPAL